MTRLTIDAAPASAVPRRFLLTAPWWGVAAGLLLAADDGGLLQSRWHPATLAATHAFTLGVLGNLLFGSLLQFLPAAAGVRLRAAARGGFALFVLLNAGALLLTAGLYCGAAALLASAAVVLAAAFTLLAAMTGPGLVTAAGQRLLRAGLGLALGAALVTATAGVTLALVLAGRLRVSLSLPALTDVHAAWGLAGWTLLTLTAVARIVMPMFQGTRPLPARMHGLWLAIVPFALIVASLAHANGIDGPLRAVVAAATLSFACIALWLQQRAPHPRNPALRAFWRAGLLALIAAAFATAAAQRSGVPAGVLGIAIAVPLLAVGMQLEIVAFLGWIDLHRRCGRGTRLPSVQRLLPEAHKWCVLAVLLGAAAASCCAVAWPSVALARVAGVALIVAFAVLALVLHGVNRRAARFLASRSE